MDENAIVVPYSNEQGINRFAFTLATVFFIGWLAEGMLRLSEEVGLTVILWIGAALMGSLAAYCSVFAFAKVWLLPERIVVTLFGKTLGCYPVEDIRFFGKMPWRPKVPQGTWGIFCYSMEELAQLRERELRKNAYTRGDIPFRKRTAGWQKEFANEWIWRKRHMPVLVHDKYCLLEFSPEIHALLKRIYPNIPLEIFGDRFGSGEPGWKDKDPLAHCRDRVNRASYTAVRVCLWIVMLLPGLIWGTVFLMGMPLNEEMLSGLLVCVLWAVPFMGLLYCAHVSYAVLCHTPQGLTLVQGRKPRAIAAEEVRTVVSIKNCDGYSRQHLYISTLDVHAFAEKAAHSLRFWGGDRAYLDACRHLAEWEQLAILRYCMKKLDMGVNDPKEVITIRRTKDREQTLRERYPDAVWIEYDIM